MTLGASNGSQSWENQPRRIASRDEQQAEPPSVRQLLLDVSNIARHDARTGIQRVVRAIASALQALPLPDTRVRLIAADRETFYRYLPDDWLKERDSNNDLRLSEHEPVSVNASDIFVGLDFCASILSRHDRRLAEWSAAGVELNIFLYDLLPLSHGRWFTLRMRRNFARWLKVVRRRADRVLAISHSVADQFDAWQRERGESTPVPVAKARLGSNISASLPSSGLPPDGAALLAWLEGRPTVLMVGTIEPRKGYEQALAAFKRLWNANSDAPQLLVIGRKGWKTERLQRKMRRQSGDGRFVWLDQASDEFLEQVYARAAGLLIASEGEGFGLPIVEGLSHGLRVLARDLPVFRELDGPGLSFFQAHSATELARAVSEWLRSDKVRGLRVVRGTADWDAAATDLVRILMPRVNLAPASSEVPLAGPTAAADVTDGEPARAAMGGKLGR